MALTRNQGLAVGGAILALTGGIFAGTLTKKKLFKRKKKSARKKR